MDKELLGRKAIQIERAMTRIKEKLGRSFNGFSEDFDAQDTVYRNFQITIQNCIDMAGHVIASKGWEIPRTMREMFDVLSTHKIIRADLGHALRKLVTLRNILVHDYTRIDHRKAYLSIRKGLELISEYCLILTNSHERKR